MKLLTELTEDIQVSMIEESSSDGTRNMYISGPFMMYGSPNRNKRIYPKDVLIRETNNYVENYVNKSRAFGELGHPSGPTINLDRTCILIKELKDRGDGNIYGKALVTSTPMGGIVRGLLQDGATLGVSSRALGSLKRQGNFDVVQEDLRITTAADVVADPSAYTAFVQGIMESKEWIMEGGIWIEKNVEKIQEEIDGAHKPTVTKEERMEKFATIFERYLANVGKSIKI